MNPQDNSNKDFDPNSPMNQMGYGSTGIAYENYDDEAMKKANEPQDASAVPINVINAVNANGIVSGRKVVDESWQKMAICAIVIAAGCLIGVIVSVIIANSLNKEIANLKIEKSSSITSVWISVESVSKQINLRIRLCILSFWRL